MRFKDELRSVAESPSQGLMPVLAAHMLLTMLTWRFALLVAVIAFLGWLLGYDVR